MLCNGSQEEGLVPEGGGNLYFLDGRIKGPELPTSCFMLKFACDSGLERAGG